MGVSTLLCGARVHSEAPAPSDAADAKALPTSTDKEPSYGVTDFWRHALIKLNMP